MTYSQIEKHIKEVEGGNPADFLRGLVAFMNSREEYRNQRVRGMTLRELLTELLKKED